VSGAATIARVVREGWQGWDEYAPFYDWENARTLGRRDVGFWTRVAQRVEGRVLELGCGTGRVSNALVEAGVDLVGIDRSAAMLSHGRNREIERSGARGHSKRQRAYRSVRGDIRSLPFADSSFAAVVAPYGVLQSLTHPGDLAETLTAVSRVLRAGGLLGIDLVPDVPNWREYENRVQLRGRHGASHLTLVESVRQDRRRRLTTFEQRYIERRDGRVQEHRFDLTFRTVTVPQMRKALGRAGFDVTAVLGDYNGRAWDARADVWIILAEKG
jgi:SAM-dependent methyltransferase